MTTKRELERLASAAFGRSLRKSDALGCAVVYVCAGDFDMSVLVPTCDDRREMLAAALRGIIAWKEGKK